MTPPNPLVSIIIPAYNRGYIIRRAVHSVLNQTYQDIEVIVVDDGSTDDTGTVIKSIQDTRLHYIRHDVRQGAAVARNTGIKAATSEFIAFQDSDDEWLCQKLERQMAIFLEAGNSVGAVYSGFLRFNGGQAVYLPSKKTKKSGNILEALLNGNFVTTQAVVIRRECFDKVGLFDECLPRLQDWDLFIRIARHYEFICIDEPLLLAFHTDVSITASNDLLPVARKIVLEKNLGLLASYKKSLARQYYSLGKSLCAVDEMAEGFQCLAKSLRHDPLRLMSWVRLLSLLPGGRFYRMSSNLIDNIGRIMERSVSGLRG